VVFRVVNWVMAGLLLASAALQYNDPDPLGWAVLYGAAAMACVQLGRWRWHQVPPILVGLAAAAWAGYLVPDLIDQARPADLMKSMDDKGGAAELAREFTGLMIVVAWMAVLAWVARRPPAAVTRRE
jgi:hypothetical protein